MDIVRMASKALGNIIVTINEEDAMEEVLQVMAELPVVRVFDWLAKGIHSLPDDVTLTDLMENEEEYDDILEENLLVEELFDDETIAELKKKFCGEEEEEPE